MAPPGMLPAPPLPSGVYMVQLGAMSSFDAAHRVWLAARNNAPQLLAAMTPRADPIVTPNGINLVRLSIGPFQTGEDATRICDALHAARMECFVRRTP
jgi:cell division septation protein DedD